jgi:hypothetical protein
MTKIKGLILMVVVALFAPSTRMAQKTDAPKMVQFQMALLKKGPKWD